MDSQYHTNVYGYGFRQYPGPYCPYQQSYPYKGLCPYCPFKGIAGVGYDSGYNPDTGPGYGYGPGGGYGYGPGPGPYCPYR